MKPLFSPAGRKALASLIETKTLFAFDFDGTLAKIVPSQAEARMSERTARLVREFAKRHPTAIVSGRSIEDLKARIEIRNVAFIGNHGVEGASATRASLSRARAICGKWRKALEKNPEFAGIEIEDKVFSLSLHYRGCADPRRARALIRDAIRALAPAPHALPGKMLVNLLPEGSPHKGTALLELMRKKKFENFLFIGDDTTDEDVFRLAKQLPRRAVTIRVGRSASSKAKFFLNRQTDVDRLLSALLTESRSARKPRAPGAKPRPRRK